MKLAEKSGRHRLLGPIVFAVAFAIAFAAASLIPPIQSPDEHSHLARAYLISKGQWSLATPPGMNSGGMVDTLFVAFFEAYATLATDPKVRLSERRKALIASAGWGATERFIPIPGTGYYFPLIYAPHALGLWVGRTLNLSIASSYQLVRAFCLLSCLGLLAYAFRLLRPPVLVVALLLLPMTVFQLLSPTLDGITTCLAVLALSLFFRQLLLGKEASSVAQTWALAASVALLASSRVHLLPLLGLPFYLAWSRGSRRDALAGAIALMVSAGWTGYALTHTVDTRVERAYSTGELLLHYAARPGTFFRMVFDSVANSDAWEGYWKSYIGILGWLDTWLPAWSYDVLWIGLALCAVASLLAVKPGEALAARALLVAAAAACASLVFLALLVTWTPHPATTIQGVQGRYFVVPALTLAYALGATLRPRSPRWPGWALVCAMAAVSCYALLTTLLDRYH